MQMLNAAYDASWSFYLAQILASNDFKTLLEHSQFRSKIPADMLDPFKTAKDSHIFM